MASSQSISNSLEREVFDAADGSPCPSVPQWMQERDSTHLEINSDEEDFDDAAKHQQHFGNVANPAHATDVGTNTEGSLSVGSHSQGSDLLPKKVPQSMLLRNLYIANLPPNITAKRLEELFSEFGQISDVRVLLDIATGTSRGIGFVMFEDPGSARDAIAKMHRHSIDGRLIQVRFAERGADEKREKVIGKVVYARNIPGKVHADQIREYFRQFGEVLEIEHHPQSHERGGPSPYNMTFIRFADEKSAEAAVIAVDGQGPFPLPSQGHPLIVAKVIRDVVGEMRKSIILRPRASQSEGSSTQPPTPTNTTMTASPQAVTPPPLPTFPFQGSAAVQHSPRSSISLGAPDNTESSISFSRDAIPMYHCVSPSAASESFGYTATLGPPMQQIPTNTHRGQATPRVDSLSRSSSWGTLLAGATPSPLVPAQIPPMIVPNAHGNVATVFVNTPFPGSPSTVGQQPQRLGPSAMNVHANSTPPSFTASSAQPFGLISSNSLPFVGTPQASLPTAPQTLGVSMSPHIQGPFQQQLQQQIQLQVQQQVQEQLQQHIQQQIYQQICQQVQSQVQAQIQQQFWTKMQGAYPPPEMGQPNNNVAPVWNIPWGGAAPQSSFSQPQSTFQPPPPTPSQGTMGVMPRTWGKY